MPRAEFGSIVRYLRRKAGPPTLQERTDAHLLEAFIAHRDAEAFAAIVSRHGPLVLSVCRRVLRHEQDAEDAFQATFLVLASKANSIRKSGSLASWLHGVGYRIAMKAKRTRDRDSRARDTEFIPRMDSPSTAATLREAQAIVDEELVQLPKRYHAPFLLCCIEGMSREEAARELGWKLGTVSSRIAQARKLLQVRLMRRGILLTTILTLLDLTRSTAASIGTALLKSTSLAAIHFVGGNATSAPTAKAAAMARGFLSSLGTATKMKIGMGLMLFCGLLTATGAAARQIVFAKAEGDSQQSATGSGEPRPGLPIEGPLRDPHGDLLPPGALARFGTLRQRAPDSQIALTADGKEIVAINRDLVVRRFDALTGALRSTFRLPGSEGINTCWLSGQASFVLVYPPSTHEKTTLDLWDLSKRLVVKRLPTQGGMVCCASFARDERRVAIATQGGFRNGEVIVWDLDSNEHKTLWTQKERFDRMYFYPIALISPDGKKVAAAHLDMSLRCWDAESTKELWVLPESGSENFFFSSDSKNVIGLPGHNDGRSTNIWDSSTGKPLQEFQSKVSWLAFPIGISPDDRLIAYQTSVGEIALWDRVNEKPGRRFPDPAAQIRGGLFMNQPRQRKFFISPDGKNMTRLSSTLQRYELNTGKAVFDETTAWGHSEGVTRIAFSPNGQLLASCSRDLSARLWDCTTTRPVHVFPDGGSNLLAFSPDSQHLFTGTSNQHTLLDDWNTSSGHLDHEFEKPLDGPQGESHDGQIRVTDDGKRILLLTGASPFAKDGILTIYDAHAQTSLGRKVVPWRAESALTPDGNSVVALDFKSQVLQRWDIETQTPRLSFQTDRRPDNRDKPISCDLILSRSGRLIASQMRLGRANYDDIRIGDLTTGDHLAKIPCNRRAVFAFSPDERLFAAAADDSIRFWDTTTWKETGIVHLPNPRDLGPSPVLALAFSPDGRRIATGHSDSTILLWKTP